MTDMSDMLTKITIPSVELFPTNLFGKKTDSLRVKVSNKYII